MRRDSGVVLDGHQAGSERSQPTPDVEIEAVHIDADEIHFGGKFIFRQNIIEAVFSSLGDKPICNLYALFSVLRMRGIIGLLIVTGRVLLRRTPVPARRKTSELEVCHGSARHVNVTRPFSNGAREAVLLQIARRRGG